MNIVTLADEGGRKHMVDCAKIIWIENFSKIIYYL